MWIVDTNALSDSHELVSEVPALKEQKRSGAVLGFRMAGASTGSSRGAVTGEGSIPVESTDDLANTMLIENERAVFPERAGLAWLGEIKPHSEIPLFAFIVFPRVTSVTWTTFQS